MGWFIAYIITALIVHILLSSFLPTAIISSKLYSLFVLASPFILLWCLGSLITFLERKGIIKSSPQKDKPQLPTILKGDGSSGPSQSPAASTLSTATTVPEIVYHPAGVDEISDKTPPQEIQAPTPATRRQPTVDEMLHSVDRLDGPAFERWCARLLEKVDFSDIQLTKSSGDQGVDIVASKDDVWYAIQCKCYSSDLGNHPVQEVHAGKNMYHCHVGVVMTNRYFTSGAKELARATGTLLWDRDKLKSILQEIQKQNDLGKA